MTTDRTFEVDELGGYQEHQGIPIKPETTEEQKEALKEAQKKANEARLAMVARTGTEADYDKATLTVCERWLGILNQETSPFRVIILGTVASRLLHRGETLDRYPDIKRYLTEEEESEIVDMTTERPLNNCEVKPETLEEFLDQLDPKQIFYFDSANNPSLSDMNDFAAEKQNMIVDFADGTRIGLIKVKKSEGKQSILIYLSPEGIGKIYYRIVVPNDLNRAAKAYDEYKKEAEKRGDRITTPLSELLRKRFFPENREEGLTEVVGGSLSEKFRKKKVDTSWMRIEGEWSLPEPPTERGWSRIGRG